MSGNSVFVRPSIQGWQAGFGNMFRAEMRSWWKTRMWWVQSLIWIGAIDGILLMIMLAGVEEIMESSLLYGVFGGLFTAVGVVIIMQGSVVGEKISGTAAWVLSKPLSRTSFILSKWLGNTIGITVTCVLLPGLVAFLIFTEIGGFEISFLDFLLGMGALVLFNLYWLSLTLMLGTFFHRRGAVIGIPLALVFGQQFFNGMLMQISERAVEYLPFPLVMPDLLENGQSVVGMLIIGSPVSTQLPIIFTIIGIIVFTLLGIWRFNREEL